MRIYRLQIRVIQLSVILTLIIMVLGLTNIWPGNAEGQPNTTTPAQNNTGSNTNSPGTNTDPGTSTDTPKDTAPQNKKIVCLGDSFTFGYPGEQKDSWPNKMKDILKVDVENAGKTYQNAADLLARFDQDVIAKEPGRVIIFAGVGDAIREKPLEEFQQNIKALVQKAEANHIKPILALTIPYPGTEKFYQQYRDWEVAFAQEKKLTVLDFKKVLFDAEGKILKKYSDDGKYPNKAGYAAMGEYAALTLQ